MSDLIDRQMAIDALGEEPEVWEDDDEYGMGMRAEWCRIKKIIEKLPSAHPCKKGKWIFHETENDRYDDMICPFCKTTYTVDAYRIDDIGFTAEDFNYCPNCGADMRGKKKE